jgi:hypothetical protein
MYWTDLFIAFLQHRVHIWNDYITEVVAKLIFQIYIKMTSIESLGWQISSSRS